jgi:EAL domain-containing protein (putative c-di-GMP-specific phosphodiesterase class I)
LLTDELDAAAVRCFTDVAKVLGVKTVAEFVDQPAVLARLREMGVDFAQGYLLHKPAPIDQILPSSQSSTNAHLSSTISI